MHDNTDRPAADLYQRVLAAGVVDRLELLDGALEQARQEGAAAALEAAALLLKASPQTGTAMLLALAAQARTGLR